MRLYGISLTRDGVIENNSFMASINPANVGEMHWTYTPVTGDPIANDGPVPDPAPPLYNGGDYITAYPVSIPTTTGGWFENVTQAKIDSTGLLPLDTSIDAESPYVYYDGDLDENVVDTDLVNRFGPYVPELKYGFDPLWNVEDDTEYTVLRKDGNEYVLDGTYLGTPKPLSIVDVPWFKRQTCLGKRLIAVYNDGDTELTNVKVRISDQTLKGAVTELTQYVNAADSWYYKRNDIGFQFDQTSISLMSYSDLVKTDGIDYRPEYVKFWLTDGNYLGLENTTMNVLEEITIDYLGPAGTKEAWAFGVLSQYVTVENGNYAGVEDDYMVLSTETNAY